MPLDLTWPDIAIRLLLTLVAGAALGFDRGVHGHAAGLRTTMLVTLAASLAMIQANWLLPVAGKHPDSFAVLDLMRLPLGILTGVGFIGAGAILRRDDLVVGVTTAATLWFATVIGLCLGGGQLVLGIVGAVLGLLVLRVLKMIENWFAQEQQIELSLSWRGDELSAERIATLLRRQGLALSRLHATVDPVQDGHTVTFKLVGHARPDDHSLPPALQTLLHHPAVIRAEWKM